jgi:N-acetylmuramoyl-L-alanine amidase
VRLTGVDDMGTGRQRRARVRALLIAASVVAGVVPTCAFGEHAAPVLAAIQAGGLPGTDQVATGARTQFVIGLERQVEFEVFSLTNPNRVFVELPDVKLQLPVLPGEAPTGLVKTFRSGLSAPGKARIVIDLTGPVVVEKAVIEKASAGKSPRLVIDITAASATEEVKPTQAKRALPFDGAFALGAAGLQPPYPKRAVSPQVRAQGMYKPVIVIDPGHGGDDTGATKNGTVEKNVVLAFSLKLREKLNATGRYKVLMTRDTDTFVDLQERRQFAERNTAALFVAVHADYAQSSARGATIYSLREGVADALQRSAKGEVVESVLQDKDLAALKATEADVGAVKEILADLARREVDMTKERTSVFAHSVIEFMGASTSLKENPDRSAAFVVLKSAKVPSILIELGYVTNENDAELLKSEKWREKVSGSIVTAIENYFSHQMARLPM